MNKIVDSSPVVLWMMKYWKIGECLSKVSAKWNYVVADIWPDNHVTEVACLGKDLKNKPEQLLSKFWHSFYVIELWLQWEPNKIVLIYTGPKLGIEKRVPDSVSQILRGETIH